MSFDSFKVFCTIFFHWFFIMLTPLLLFLGHFYFSFLQNLRFDCIHFFIVCWTPSPGMRGILKMWLLKCPLSSISMRNMCKILAATEWSVYERPCTMAKTNTDNMTSYLSAYIFRPFKLY